MNHFVGYQMTKHLLEQKAQSRERKQVLGEVFTPLPLVDEILHKLPEETWTPDKTYLDPSCGDGNFLVRVIAFKIFNGSTVEQALSTTYGVDLMADNINHCKQRVLIHAFVSDVLGRKKLLKQLNHQHELQLTRSEEYPPFFNKYKHIVNQNIVCHDALTYHYNFNEVFDDIVLLQSSEPPEHIMETIEGTETTTITKTKTVKVTKQIMSPQEELEKINEILKDPTLRANFKEWTKWDNKRKKLIQQINGF